MKIIFSLILFAFLSVSSEVMAKSCDEVRMGLDIGSGSTKMMVARVDFCKKKILEILLNESKPLAFNEDLDKNKDGNLSPAIVAQGQEVLNELISKGKVLRPKKFYGVATSAFRKAKNGTEVIRKFAKKFKMKIEVISQEEEAVLGHLSALSILDEAERSTGNIVVWDIGGGSMQMFSLDENKTPQMYLGQLASVTFKNMVIEAIEAKDLATTKSPNPIGDKIYQVLALARSYARIHVPLNIKTALKNHTVVGVGGVHSQSLKNQLDLKTMKYSIEDLQKASKIQVQKSDEELTGNYRATDVTNLLLVQGFMEALEIKNVRIVDASLLQGVVLR